MSLNRCRGADSPLRAVRQLQVFRPFFVSLNLPYAVKRGEVVGIQCVVFNYHQTDLVADVTLEHQGDLEFTSFSDEADNKVEGEEKKGTEWGLKTSNRGRILPE